MIRVRLSLPSDFSFDRVVRSHGWYDLPPFSYEREKGVLRTSFENRPLTPADAAEGPLRILGRHEYLALDSRVRQEYRRRYPGPRRTTDRAIARRYARDMERIAGSRSGWT